MSDGDRTSRTDFDLAATLSEFTDLAQLAFASREVGSNASHVGRDLGLLSPDALDMDLSDPLQRDFGDYELIEKVGQGGMGVVYRAHQRSLNRDVALKLLIAGPWAPQKFVDRFQLEAQSAARLEHPNIVTVFETGSQHDLHYFTMRLVRGESLSAILRRNGRLPSREAARIVRVIAEAVDYAHRLDVLHLDLKPGNVLIDADGEPLVADFGLARRLDEVLANSPSETAGTPCYMAPEQANPKMQALGVTTDVYGLGCILYELLCARPPFVAASARETLQKVLQQAVVPPRAIEGGVPRDLEAICLKCLAKDPAVRYTTAGELAEDLQAFLQDRQVSVRQPPALERTHRWIRREPRLAAAVTGVAVTLLIGLGATLQQWQRAEQNAFAAQELTWESRREAALALEQDGRGLEAAERLLDNLAEQEAVGATQHAETERLRLGNLLNRGAQLINERTIPDAQAMTVALSPDEQLLVVAFADLTLRWYETATLQEVGRVSMREALAPGSINRLWRTSDGEPRLPQLLRFVDERRLLVTFEWIANRVSPMHSDTWLVDIDAGSVTEPPAGYTVAAFSGNAQWALLDGNGGIELWQVTPRWNRIAEVDATDAQAWVLSGDGSFAFSLGRGGLALQYHAIGSADPPREITLGEQNGIAAWMLSGDSRTLALGSFDGNAYVLSTDTLSLRQLSTQRGRELTWLQFSADDQWLATADYDGLVQVIDLAADDLVLGVGMRAGFIVRRVRVDKQQRLVVAAGEGQTALWRVPQSDLRIRPASRIGTAPSGHQSAWLFPSDWSASGLFAEAGLDGNLRLWRLPDSPYIDSGRRLQAADIALPDAERVIDVEWNYLRLVSPDGESLTRWLELEQPPGFAELFDDGRILLLTQGPRLHAFDTADFTPLYAPVQLPATPQRMIAQPNGRWVGLSFGEHGDYGHEETLRAFDAVDGRWLPGEIVLDGPVHRYAFSADGEWIVAMGAPLSVTTVITTDGLEMVNTYIHDPAQPVASVDFKGKQLLMVTQTQPDNPNCVTTSALLQWNPLTDEELAIPVDGEPCRVRATATGYALFGRQFDQLVHDSGEKITLTRPANPALEGKPIIAFSGDGRMLVRGYRHSAQIYDALTGEPIGAPLDPNISSYDFLIDMAFVDGGRSLRGRSIAGWDLHWDTSTIDAERINAFDLITDRRVDPGPWRLPATRPRVAVAANSAADITIPARSRNTPPHLLDLSPVYNQRHEDFRNPSFHATPTFGQMPPGMQRIGGVDFDLRALVQLGVVGDDATVALAFNECVAVPRLPVLAVHLLARNGLETAVDAGEVLAELTFRYVDGGAAAVPLRAGIELLSYGFDDSLVPSVFATYHHMSRGGGAFHEVLAPRLENPEPGRAVRCIDLEWLAGSGSLTVFAATVETL